MNVRFIKIDDLIRNDHYYLNSDDDCYYLLEYTAGKGFDHSHANQLISNLKKSPLLKEEYQYRYKTIAIRDVINYFRALMPKDYLEDVTLVPMPPSKAKDDEEYDDRMVQVLNGLCFGNNCDLRELIILKESIKASHKSELRPTPNVLSRYFELDEALCDPSPSTILIFDDMITTGCHFRACKDILSLKFPDAIIIGVFITRRAIENEIIDFD